MQKRFSNRIIRILPPLTLLISSALSQGVLMPPLTLQKLGLLLRISLFIYITFEAGYFVAQQIQKQLPQLYQTKKRLLLTYLAAVVISFVFITISTIINRMYITKPVSFFDESMLNFIQCLWIGILIAAPYEANYSYVTLLKNEKEKEQLLRINMENQLNALRNQLNPHFLFNNLNTLSSLIMIDPHKAEEFVVEMSALYRNFLKNNRATLISLKEELAFIQSYIHLLKARFDNGLLVTIVVEESCMAKLLSSLSLQLLVENAIKHNEVNPDKPLKISIATEDDKTLTVTNNLQPKVSTLSSTGFGLSSLLSQYKYLKLPDVVIEEKNQEFRVVLPLINPDNT